MSRIKVTNTAIIIDNYELGENSTLEYSFKKFDPIYHKSEYFCIYYDKYNKRLYMPAGIDLSFVKNKLGERYYDRISNHPYLTFDPIMMKHPPRNNTQIEILKFMCDANEMGYDVPHQKSLNANTGVGKSWSVIATICYFSCKALIIMHSNSLIKQWIKEFKYHTNIKDNEIMQINGSAVCNAIINDNSRFTKPKVFLCNHGTIRSFAKTFGWDKLSLLTEKLGIGIKVFDEAHQDFDNLMMIDYFTNTWKTFYVTATPDRSDFTESKAYKLAFKNVPSIDLFDENEDPRTSYTAIKFNSHPSAQQISRMKNKYGLDRMKYMDYLTKKPEFYDMLSIIMNDLVTKCKGKVLMYIGTNEGILRVYYWIMKNYPEYIGRVGIFTSLVNKEEKLKEREKDIILSTLHSASAGEDISGLKMTIVLAEPFKSSVLARQSLGRTRDRNTVYIDLVDLGFIQTRRFYNAKLPTFNKYALNVYDDHIDSRELYIRSQNIKDDRDTWKKQVIHFDHDKRFPELDKLLPPNIIGIPERDENAPRCPIRFVKNKGKLLD